MATARCFRAGSAFASVARAPTMTFARRFHASPSALKVHAIKSEKDYYEAIKKPTVLVDCFAEWCHPCKIMSPILETISEQYPDVHFIKFDVDELRDVAAELKIRAMPTFIMFKNGEKVEEFIGANPGQLAKLVEKHQR